MGQSPGTISVSGVIGIVLLYLKIQSIFASCSSLERGPSLGLSKLSDGLWQNDMYPKQNSIRIFNRKWKWTFSTLKDVQHYRLTSQLKANMRQDHRVTRSCREKD